MADNISNNYCCSSTRVTRVLFKAPISILKYVGSWRCLDRSCLWNVKWWAAKFQWTIIDTLLKTSLATKKSRSTWYGGQIAVQYNKVLQIYGENCCCKKNLYKMSVIMEITVYKRRLTEYKSTVVTSIKPHQILWKGNWNTWNNLLFWIILPL
jgi:hypothetical protein